jgi:uncharacterized membrane protein
MKINDKSWHYKLIKNYTNHYNPKHSIHTSCAYIETLILACLSMIFRYIGIGFIFHIMFTEIILWGYFTRFDPAMVATSSEKYNNLLFMSVGVWVGIITIMFILLITESSFLSNIYRFCIKWVCNRIEYVDE